MARIPREVDILIERRPGGGYFASALGDEEVAAIGDDRNEVVEKLTAVIERVLRYEPDRFEDRADEPTPVARHIRLNVPAARMGHLLSLDLQLFAATVARDEGMNVQLPQLGAQLLVKDPGQLELMCAEWIRDTYPLESRVPELLRCVSPLFVSDEDGDAPRFEIDRVRVRFKPEPADIENDEQDIAPTLSAVGDPLHHRLARKDAPRAFERRGEVDALLGALADSAERSVLLIGAAGVGKTAIVQEAVRRIIDKDAPESLREAGVWQISGGRLMAGMRFLGQWQERVLEVINDAKQVGAILFIENLVELLETTGTEKHAEGIPGLLLPHILSGEIVVITEAQPEQLARAEQSHPSFLRALRRQPVEPLNPAKTDEVLNRVSFRLGRQFGVRLAPETRQRILELVGRFKGAAELPGPAVELAERMARTHRKQGVITEEDDRPLLLPEHAVNAYASLTGLPLGLLDSDAEFDIAEVRRFFEDRIFAQPESVDAMVDLVTCVRAGLNSPTRPLGSFLFLGPTGVGKTQTALSLAEYMFGSSERLVRFDMSEYQDAWAAGRLVGRYRGERGELVKRVREQPFQVLLMDEIEKAHSNVFDFLLQVLGEGRLTDGLGQTVSLTSAIIIMTSNLGAGGPPALGFSRGDADAHRSAEVLHYRGAVEKFFRPEFVGRIDNVIPFRSLGPQTAHQLVERALEQAFNREGLVRRNIRVTAGEDVVEFLIRVGFDERYGARPLRRAVENYITAPLGQFLSRESGLSDISLRLTMRDGLPAIEVV